MDSIRQVDYFYVQVPNKAGEAAKVLAKVKEAGVNLLLFHGFPATNNGQLDFVPADAAAFQSVAKANKWNVVGPKKAFLVQGDDRVGACGDALQKLASANINVVAVTGISAGSRYGMIVWVGAKDVAKAASVLGAT